MEWLKDAAAVWGAIAIVCATVAGIWAQNRKDRKAGGLPVPPPIPTPNETSNAAVMAKLVDAMHQQALGTQEVVNLLGQVVDTNRETHNMLRILLDRQYDIHQLLGAKGVR